LIPLKDATRRPLRTPLIIAVNILVFLMELARGDAFVSHWSLVPAQITSGHQWITILTAMFMHVRIIEWKEGLKPQLGGNTIAALKRRSSLVTNH
jgi:membrane associated rhomboid family serine protease